jgi:hypothetical protein
MQLRSAPAAQNARKEGDKDNIATYVFPRYVTIIYKAQSQALLKTTGRGDSRRVPYANFMRSAIVST